MDRRSLLAALGAGGLAAVAGCGALAGDGDRPTETPVRYDYLTARTVYLASGVSLTLPADTPEADDPDDADLLVLPEDPDVDPETGIDWLAAGTGVAFVGSGGQATLIEWLESDAYDEVFGSGGIGEASPPPDFLLAFGIDRQYVSTYGYTWNDTDDPSNRRYLVGIEEALEDLENG
jgi:hypothetical protein